MRLDVMIEDYKVRRMRYKRIDLLKFVDLLLEDRDALLKPKKRVYKIKKEAEEE